MKKIPFVLLGIATIGAIMFAGCKKDSEVVTLGVSLESAAADGKLYIDGSRNPVFLASGEQINVNGQTVDVVKEGDQYSVTVPSASAYYAAYPASLPTAEGGFAGTSGQAVQLPRRQQYVCDASGVQNVKLPAAAVLTDRSSKLRFYNLCSLLEVQWTNSSNDAYDIIGIEVTVPGQALYGAGTASLSQATSAITMAGSTSQNRTSLDIAAADRETVAAGNASRKYYVVLPPFESKAVSVRIQTMKHSQASAADQKLRTVSVSTQAAVTLPRNYIVPMHISAAPAEDNSLTGYFSVSDNLKVVFSRGNLQHVGSTSHSTGTWQFADRQYDFFGCKNISSNGYNLTNTMDLFCWSSSSYNDFGMSTYDRWRDYNNWANSSTTFNDWGYYKQISGDPAQTWFTPSVAEWYYLLYQRTNSANLFGKAKITNIIGHQGTKTVGGTTTYTEVYGFVLLPDDWTAADVPTGLTFTPNSASDAAEHNVYTASEWARMEAAGAMFLPAAGWGSNYHNTSREHSDGSDIFSTFAEGQYWTSSRRSGTWTESGFLNFKYQYATWFLTTTTGVAYTNGSSASDYDNEWWHMRSVRLVKPAPGYTDSRSTVNQ